MGNPETDKTEAVPEKEDNFRFPPVTNSPILTQNRITGDVWLGFNCAKFPLRVILAWCAFQVENIYFQFEQQIRAAQQARGLDIKGDGKKKSMRDILTAPFRR